MEINKSQEYLLLPKGIALNKQERQEMCRILESGLKEIYNVRKFYQGMVEVEGVSVRYEIIAKSVNNRLLLKKLVWDERKEIITNVRSKEDLFEFVKENIEELLRPTGRYFNAVYSLLKATSYVGDRAEGIAFRQIEEIGKKKGLQIQVLKPREVADDVYGGVDGFFVYNDREFTIQIKPLSPKFDPPISENKRDPQYFIAYVDGFIKEVKTDYLALVDNKAEKCYLFQAKGIIASSTSYLIPKSNLVNVD